MLIINLSLKLLSFVLQYGIIEEGLDKVLNIHKGRIEFLVRPKNDFNYSKLTSFQIQFALCIHSTLLFPFSDSILSGL